MSVRHHLLNDAPARVDPGQDAAEAGVQTLHASLSQCSITMPKLAGRPTDRVEHDRHAQVLAIFG